MNNGVRHSKRKKRRVLALRRAGWSIPRIALDLGISKSSVSLWCKGIEISITQATEIKADGMLRAGLAKSLLFKAIVDAARADAIVAWDTLRLDPMFMLGVGLYMGEGHKRSCTLGMTNSDPGVIRSWIKWCMRFASECEFRSRIQVHSEAQKESARAFWGEIIGEFCPIGNAHAYVSSASKGRRQIERLPNGTITIEMRNGSRLWHAKMMEWIRLTTG